MELLNTRAPRLGGGLRQQGGAVLFVTLVVLVLLALGAVSVVRSMDTTNLIAGNFAFKQAAMQASDRAITDGMNNLANIVASGGGNTDVNNRYFALRQTSVDALGIPAAIDWTKVSCADETGAAVAKCDESTGKYRIQYYIERQCDAAPTLADPKDIKTKCDYEVRTATPAEQIAIRYRIIIRVRGPRNATGIYEVMVSGPSST